MHNSKFKEYNKKHTKKNIARQGKAPGGIHRSPPQDPGERTTGSQIFPYGILSIFVNVFGIFDISFFVFSIFFYIRIHIKAKLKKYQNKHATIT